ncbi:hypothetical protein [Streptomyces sp. NPDC050560]|uniref:hypothetical protein n=1 Tax=Streptomyces sp. NPDC050560 TaxID=3365630 RepID=UPI0037B58B31
MARSEYGAGVADFIVTPADGLWQVGAGVSVTFWDSPADGIQYTDLLDADGGPLTAVTADEFGALPRFFGPEDTIGMWADAGGGTRAWMDAHSLTAGAPGDEDPAPVTSVNGQTGTVELDADDVGAIPAEAAGAPEGVAQLDEDGHVPTEQLPEIGGAVDSVNGKTGTVVLAAADVGAVDLADVGSAGGVADLDTDSRVPDAHLLPYGFRPTDLGMLAWSFDPAAGTSGGRAPSTGSFRITAIPVRETMTVTKLVWHVLGYEGTGLDAGSNAGIFAPSGALWGDVGSMIDATKMPAVHNAGGQTVAVPLSEPVDLDPGIWYIGFRFMIGTSANAPIMMCADSTNATPVVTLDTDVKPFGVISGLSSWPTSFNLNAVETDPIRFWAALA